MSQTSNTISRIHFVNTQEGWAFGSGGVVRRTMNAGLTWEIVNSGTTEDINDVFFMTTPAGRQLWAVGNSGKVLQTGQQGGLAAGTDVVPSVNLYGVHFASQMRGWVVGAGGHIWITDTGGSTWVPQNSPTTQDLRSVFFFDQNVGVAVGGSGFVGAVGRSLGDPVPHRVILRTVDAGQTWQVVRDIEGDPYHQVVFVDAQRGWACAGGEYYAGPAPGTGPTGAIDFTPDGGVTWTNQVSGLTEPVYDLWMLNENVGWAVGADSGRRGSTSPPTGGSSGIGYTQTQPVRSNIRHTTTGGRR